MLFFTFYFVLSYMIAHSERKGQVESLFQNLIRIDARTRSFSLPPFFLCLCKQAQTNNGCPYSYSHICILYDLCLGQYRFIACFIFISENLQFYANVFTRFAHSFFFLWFVVIIVLHLAENEHNFRVKEIRKAGKQNTF